MTTSIYFDENQIILWSSFKSNTLPYGPSLAFESPE